MPLPFRGFPAEAVAFYEGLAADNSRTYWQAHSADYQAYIKGPFTALLETLGAYGPFHVFRPNRDVRFAKDKTPYKENIGAVGESQAGTVYFVSFSATEMAAGSGYYHLATDQLERFRAAVGDDASGVPLAALTAAAQASGMELAASETLKTAPRGYAKDHPRVDLLRRKGLVTMRRWPQAAWMRTSKAAERVRATWDEGAAVDEWMDRHVGPSTLPPPEHGW